MSAARSHRMFQLLDRAEQLGESLEDVARTWAERLTGEQVEAMAATSAAITKLRAAFDDEAPATPRNDVPDMREPYAPPTMTKKGHSK